MLGLPKHSLLTATIVCAVASSTAAQLDNPFEIRIGHVEEVESGDTVTMFVEHVSGAEAVGYFRFNVMIDHAEITFVGAAPGPALQRCQWGRFEYRLLQLPPIPGESRTILQAFGRADGSASCFELQPYDTLFSFRVVIDNSPVLNCASLPVRFYWLNCGDNILVSVNPTDTAYHSQAIFDPYLIDTPPPDTFPTHLGAPNECIGEILELAIRGVEFHNGWIEMMCDLDAPQPGDVNLDGDAFTIADAVLMSNYFVSGESVLTKDVEQQIRAGDCNLDGLSMTVADMIYMIRVIVGDARPYPVESLLPDTIAIDPSVDVSKALPAD